MKQYFKIALLGLVAAAILGIQASPVDLREALRSGNVDELKSKIEEDPQLITRIPRHVLIAEKYPALLEIDPRELAQKSSNDVIAYLAATLIASDDYKKLLIEIQNNDFQNLITAINKQNLETVKNLIEKHPQFLTNYAVTEYGIIPDEIYKSAWGNAWKPTDTYLEHDKEDNPIFKYLAREKKLRPTLKAAEDLTRIVVKRIGDTDHSSGSQLEYVFLKTPGIEEFDERLYHLAASLGWEGEWPWPER